MHHRGSVESARLMSRESHSALRAAARHRIVVATRSRTLIRRRPRNRFERVGSEMIVTKLRPLPSNFRGGHGAKPTERGTRNAERRLLSPPTCVSFLVPCRSRCSRAVSSFRIPAVQVRRSRPPRLASIPFLAARATPSAPGTRSADDRTTAAVCRRVAAAPRREWSAPRTAPRSSAWRAEVTRA